MGEKQRNTDCTLLPTLLNHSKWQQFFDFFFFKHSVYQGKGVKWLDRNQKEDFLAGDKNKETAGKKKKKHLNLS